jgi:hypothetical protein
MVKLRYFVLRGTSCAFISTLRVYCKVNVQLYKPLPNKREFRGNQRCNSHNSGCETWVLKESTIQRLSVVERKIFGLTKENNAIWRIKTNKKLDELIKYWSIINYVKA